MFPNCYVDCCKHPSDHTTEGHLCGKCKIYGHGFLECGDTTKIEELKKLYGGASFPYFLRCNVFGCERAYDHTNYSHNCSYCFENHSVLDCNHLKYNDDPFDSIRPEFVLERQGYDLNIINQYLNKPNTYLIVHEGMGCYSVIRKTSFMRLEGLFIHSDDWAYNKNKIDNYKNFIKDYSEVVLKELLVHNWTGEK